MITLLRTVLTSFVLCVSLACLEPAKAQEAESLKLQISQTPDGQTQLTWTPLPGNPSYSVETKLNIDSPWIELNSPIAETQLAIETASTQQFFRVIAQATPTSEIPNRGRLISAEKVGEVPALSLSFILLLLPGLPADADRSVPYNVDLYKITYETIDPSGAPTIASAGIALPQGLDQPLPVASYQHPTVLQRSNVPSNPDSAENLGGVFMAAGGFFTVMPDYLGLGDSELFHPFIIAKPTATASVDALRAATTFATTEGVTTTEELFLLGYSEGGYATMSLHREIELLHSDEFTVTASVPMAGPYDLSNTVRDEILSNQALAQPYQLPYQIAAISQYQDVGFTFEEMLRDDLATTIPPLFNGMISGAEINPQLPSLPFEILSDAAIEALADSTHPLSLALQENDVYQWQPKGRVRLYHCASDEVVSISNSRAALEYFQQFPELDVELIDPGMDLDHVACAIPSIVAARQWLNSIR